MEVRFFSRKFGQFAMIFAGLIATSHVTFAQQNLFNVPSGQITKSGDVFFQEQFNFTRPVGSSNTTIDVGLGQGWEVGFNALDLNFYEKNKAPSFGQQQVNPDVIFNAQKGFELIDEVWSLGIGSQMGFNPAGRNRDIRYLNFTWVINELTLPDDKAKIYAGGYYSNIAYAGPGKRFGFMAGTEIPIVKDKFHFQADIITGTRDISVAVIGGVFFLPKKWQISIGAQVPLPGSGNPYGAVVEITQPGYALFHRNRE